jgi:hypothetical protein
MTLPDQYLAIRKAELDRLEQQRRQGIDVPDWLYAARLEEYKELEENERLRKVFFPV